MLPFKYRELGRLMKERRGHELTLAVPLPTSPKGMNNLRCPSEVCQPRVFQLGEGSPTSGESDPRSRRAPGQPIATCPYCGHDGDQEAFFHPDDIEAIKEQVLWAASRDVGHALEDMARGFNRRSRNRFFSLTMEVKGLNTPRPFFQREDLLRDLTCDVCRRRYGVYAIGLFCPDCGAANLHVHFARETALVAQQIEIAQAIESELGSELAYRILGNAHEDVVTAFETYLKTAYRFLVRRCAPCWSRRWGTSSSPQSTANQPSITRASITGRRSAGNPDRRSRSSLSAIRQLNGIDASCPHRA